MWTGAAAVFPLSAALRSRGKSRYEKCPVFWPEGVLRAGEKYSRKHLRGVALPAREKLTSLLVDRVFLWSFSECRGEITWVVLEPQAEPVVLRAGLDACCFSLRVRIVSA